MCKLLLGIKLNNSSTQEFGRILRLQEEDLRTEKDGISAVRIRKDDKVVVIKRLNNYSPVFDDIYRHMKESKIVSIHTRQATSGTIDLSNTHYFEVDDCLFAHNGFVNDYCNWDSGRKEKSCDSYRFLANLEKPITKRILKKAIEKKGFIGFGILIDKERKKIFILTTRELEAHTDFKTYFFLYSFTPEDVIRSYRHFAGFKILQEENVKKLETFIIEKGIYEIDFDIKTKIKRS